MMVAAAASTLHMLLFLPATFICLHLSDDFLFTFFYYKSMNTGTQRILLLHISPLKISHEMNERDFKIKAGSLN